MNALFVFTLMFLLVGAPFAYAHEDEEFNIKAEDILLEKDFPASAKVRALKLRVHKAGHLEDRPYVIEISEMCPTSRSVTDQPVVIDTASACDVATNTLKFDEETSELSILVREPSAVGSKRSTETPDCRTKSKLLKFQLRSRCDRG